MGDIDIAAMSMTDLCGGLNELMSASFPTSSSERGNGLSCCAEVVRSPRSSALLAELLRIGVEADGGDAGEEAYETDEVPYVVAGESTSAAGAIGLKSTAPCA